MTNYFLSQSLSQKLVERGVVSQFNYSYYPDWGLLESSGVEICNASAGDYCENTHTHSEFVKTQHEYIKDNTPYTGPVKLFYSCLCNSYHGPEVQSAIHVFDLLGDVQNAIKVWGGDEHFGTLDRIYHTRKLLELVQSNGDYEGYIESTMVV